MNSSLHADIDSDEDTDGPAEREISLGVATILGIFFTIALICAGFFGFGYTLGRKSAQNAAIQAATASGGPPITVKPAAGSLADEFAPAQPAPSAADIPATVAVPVATPKNRATPADAMIAGDKPVAANKLPPATENPHPATDNPPPPISPTSAFMVQVAAVSSQEIADIELTALKKYGFDVVVRHEPQDQLLHVQIGPFATRKDAEAMRANVLSHGFNAIVK